MSNAETQGRHYTCYYSDFTSHHVGFDVKAIVKHGITIINIDYHGFTGSKTGISIMQYFLRKYLTSAYDDIVFTSLKPGVNNLTETELFLELSDDLHGEPRSFDIPSMPEKIENFSPLVNKLNAILDWLGKRRLVVESITVRDGYAQLTFKALGGTV